MASTICNSPARPLVIEGAKRRGEDEEGTVTTATHRAEAEAEPSRSMISDLDDPHVVAHPSAR